MTTDPTLPPFDDDPDLACRRLGTDRAVFFPPAGKQGEKATRLAKAICRGCDRRDECLERALDAADVDYGILGGRTPTERRDLLAVRTTRGRRPARPARADVPYGWNHGHRADTDKHRRLFVAVDWYVEHGNTRLTAARYAVPEYRLQEAIAIRQWTPELVADVLDGWVSWAAAYRHAQEVRRWHQVSGHAA